jgi:hypothetical protein
MTPPDHEGYRACLDDLNRREMSNAETYDKSLLTLSSALLGLSLTFIGNVVPISQATALCLLYLAWAALAATIALTISSFIYGQSVIRDLKAGAKAYFLEGKRISNDESVALSARLHLLNTSTGVTFIAGVFFLSLYVGVNVNRESAMPDKEPPVQVPLKKSQPVPSFDQFAPKPPQQQPQQQPQQGGEQKK